MSSVRNATNWLAAIEEAYDMLLQKAEQAAVDEENLHKRINAKIQKPGWEAAINATWDALEERNSEIDEPFQLAARRPRGGSISPNLRRQCEYLHDEVDIPTCRAVSRQRGPQAAARCFASANERYANCIARRPLPPLDVWNN